MHRRAHVRPELYRYECSLAEHLVVDIPASFGYPQSLVLQNTGLVHQLGDILPFP